MSDVAIRVEGLSKRYHVGGVKSREATRRRIAGTRFMRFPGEHKEYA